MKHFLFVIISIFFYSCGAETIEEIESPESEPSESSAAVLYIDTLENSLLEAGVVETDATGIVADARIKYQGASLFLNLSDDMADFGPDILSLVTPGLARLDDSLKGSALKAYVQTSAKFFKDNDSSDSESEAYEVFQASLKTIVAVEIFDSADEIAEVAGMALEIMDDYQFANNEQELAEVASDVVAIVFEGIKEQQDNPNIDPIEGASSVVSSMIESIGDIEFIQDATEVTTVSELIVNSAYEEATQQAILDESEVAVFTEAITEKVESSMDSLASNVDYFNEEDSSAATDVLSTVVTDAQAANTNVDPYKYSIVSDYMFEVQSVTDCQESDGRIMAADTQDIAADFAYEACIEADVPLPSVLPVCDFGEYLLYSFDFDDPKGLSQGEWVCFFSQNVWYFDLSTEFAITDADGVSACDQVGGKVVFSYELNPQVACSKDSRLVEVDTNPTCPVNPSGQYRAYYLGREGGSGWGCRYLY